jgi:hypothetical protein
MLDPLTEACCFGLLILSVVGWLHICLRQRRLILASVIDPLDATDSIYPTNPVGLVNPVDSTGRAGRNILDIVYPTLPVDLTVPDNSTGSDNHTTPAERAGSVKPVGPVNSASRRSLRRRRPAYLHRTQI